MSPNGWRWNPETLTPAERIVEYEVIADAVRLARLRLAVLN
jgi:hypothetical protein